MDLDELEAIVIGQQPLGRDFSPEVRKAFAELRAARKVVEATQTFMELYREYLRRYAEIPDSTPADFALSIEPEAWGLEGLLDELVAVREGSSA